MNQIPPLGWLAIIAIVLITIVINGGLVALFRGRGQMKGLTSRLQSRPPSRTVQTIHQIKEVVRDPFRQEREQLNELSRLVSKLDQPDESGRGSQSPPGEPDHPENR